MDLKSIRGISSKRENDLAKLGIYSAEDLIRLYPRTYLDMTRCTPLSEAANNGYVLTLATVLSVDSIYTPKTRYVRADCVQGGMLFRIYWFNAPYVRGQLKEGDYYFYGLVKKGGAYGPSMTNPVFESADAEARRLSGIAPVYGLKGVMPQGSMRAAMRDALSKVSVKSVIPDGIAERHGLMPLGKAYSLVHFPETPDDIAVSSERIAVEEYFVLQAAFRMAKGDACGKRTREYAVTAGDVREFASAFPFEFTEGQKNAVNEIYHSLTSDSRMNRLIQGDVGCGKTAVSHCAVFMAVKSGYQAVMLSPTEVLAEQSFTLMKKSFPEYRVAYLAGSLTAKEKRETKKAIAEGDIDIVCGTHAVISADVAFKNLALCVCDEQHRFGVAQRAALAGKGEGCDMLVMSATPIPRTLSLIMYGDLDITTIKDKPAYRQKVSTSIIKEDRYEGLLKYVASEAAKGRQSYFVCPKIDGDGEDTVRSVTETYKELKEAMPGVRIALLHGRMKEAEKVSVMRAFKNRECDVLVSTTVIEVGVDVPNATIMVIYSAERFGLAQLHQLRGRVGRGEEKSYCFLVPGSCGGDSLKRLRVLKESDDGFEIAEKDLEMRGRGDFMGTRQSGNGAEDVENLRFSVDAVYKAKELCDEAFAGGYDLSDTEAAARGKYARICNVVMN